MNQSENTFICMSPKSIQVKNALHESIMFQDYNFIEDNHNVYVAGVNLDEKFLNEMRMFCIGVYETLKKYNIKDTK